MIYFMLHGFASATPNATSTFFEDNVLEDSDSLFNLNYPFNKDAASVLIDAVEDILVTHGSILRIPAIPLNDNITFVGCSLGGYMAQHMASIYSGSAIVINPAVIPHEDLSRFLGVNSNYTTAKIFNLTEEDVASFKDFYVPPGIVPTLVLLDMGDELLDSKETVKHFLDNADVKMFTGGSHRFDHLPEALSSIKEFANTII